MVKAGPPVDAVIEQLVPLLEPGDIIIDGGNSLFTDTQRRCKDLEGKGMHFVGMGVSGGEEGALKGPSLMPGGNTRSVGNDRADLPQIAAKVDGGRRVATTSGPDGAGHYVKMVHNGIEYGDMQLICEAYDHPEARPSAWTPTQLAEIFAEWNKGDLDSYLIEITAADFSQDRSRDRQAAGRHDPGQGRPKRDRQMDAAIALELGDAVVISTINAAVEARIISSRKEERVAAAKILPQPEAANIHGRTRSAHRRGPRRALRLQDRLLCPGHGVARRGQQESAGI